MLRSTCTPNSIINQSHAYQQQHHANPHPQIEIPNIQNICHASNGHPSCSYPGYSTYAQVTQQRGSSDPYACNSNTNNYNNNTNPHQFYKNNNLIVPFVPFVPCNGQFPGYVHYENEPQQHVQCTEYTMCPNNCIKAEQPPPPCDNIPKLPNIPSINLTNQPYINIEPMQNLFDANTNSNNQQFCPVNLTTNTNNYQQFAQNHNMHVINNNNRYSLPPSTSTSTVTSNANSPDNKAIFNPNYNMQEMNKKHICTECGKRFRYLSLLDRHITSHSTAKPHPCDYPNCNKRFQHKYYLHQHKRRTHNAVKKYQCVYCEKAFVEKCNLKIHIRKHTGEKPYQCQVCFRRFSVKTNMDAHLRIHSNEKPFTCQVCNRSFARKAYLTQHTRIHTGEKPFQCEFCGKRCTQIGDLKKHIRTHTGEKPFQCKICEKKFRYSSHLKAHSRKLHPAFIC